MQWLVLIGAGLAAALIALVFVRRAARRAPPRVKAVAVTSSNAYIDTGRLLDNFEQRFAELKGKTPDPSVMSDLYDLGTQLEQRGRRVHATAVFRHLARFDGGFRDVSKKLASLMQAEESAKSKAAERAPVETRAEDMPPDIGAPDLAQLGRYRLEREIGRGAMGTVYLGRDSAINRLVAVKAIPLAREFSETELVEARKRFFREAETAGRLNHPNIVTIYDVGEQDGIAYIAMEYLKGRHMSDFVSQAGALEPRKVVDLIARTADALGFAHKQGVVHRDIKPANLMYDAASDVLKITDFGIARLTDSGSTRTGIVLGTPSFMSPEQLEGRTVTGHSDLFSLGVTLYQLLTGQLPFRADTMTGLMQQIAEAPHPPIKALRPDFPDCVQDILDRALAKKPEARFDSGAQMAISLNDCRARMASGLP